jgi:ethanolamine ammonia-lyase small subunit
LFIEYLKNNEIKNDDLHIFCLSNLLTESITSEHKEVIEKFLKYSFKNKTKQENIEIFKLLH